MQDLSLYAEVGSAWHVGCVDARMMSLDLSGMENFTCHMAERCCMHGRFKLLAMYAGAMYAGMHMRARTTARKMAYHLTTAINLSTPSNIKHILCTGCASRSGCLDPSLLRWQWSVAR